MLLRQVSAPSASSILTSLPPPRHMGWAVTSLSSPSMSAPPQATPEFWPLPWEALFLFRCLTFPWPRALECWAQVTNSPPTGPHKTGKNIRILGSPLLTLGDRQGHTPLSWASRQSVGHVSWCAHVRTLLGIAQMCVSLATCSEGEKAWV